jgi:subtilisin family serine protease
MQNRRAMRSHRAAVALLALALTTGLMLAAAPAAVPAPAGGLKKVDARILKAVSGGKSTTYWAILSTRADVSAAASITDWSARGWYVYNKLTGVANATQRGLRSLLRAQGAHYNAFWIINAVRITSRSGTLSKVAGRSEVVRVLPAWHATVETPVLATPTSGVQTVEWGINRIRAPQVWSTYNDRGENVTVANIDTGVQFDHPALKKRYRGIGTIGTTVRHDYNWWDPAHVCNPQGKAPCDNVDHGTHTMGTMVGDDGTGNQIGVAPNARWIAAKGCESTSCSDFALLSSGQWVLAPTKTDGSSPRPDLRPQIVNNSWGGGPGDPFYRSTVQSWVAAGIFPAFASGNSGPFCGTAGSPGDYPESYGVGAFDINNRIASFSSRGPSAFGGMIKPNISAPGVNVRSSIPVSSYANFNGTSMATPHLAGTVALIWSTQGAPSLRGNVAATRAILDQTAIDVSSLACGGTAGNNNVWGQGRLDAFAAVTKAKGL